MTWVKIKNKKADVWSFEVNNELEGKYTGMKENVGKNNSRLYYVEKTDGEEVAFWGSALLDSQMKSVTIGLPIRVRYLGMAKSEKTKRSYKNFEIEVDEDETQQIAN